MTMTWPAGDQRRLCPPKLVSVYNGDAWVPEQLLGWRIVTGRCRCLVRPAHTIGYDAIPARWVDAGAVRPRDFDGADQRAARDDQWINGDPVCSLQRA
jgi:hypothetical protein